MNRYIFLALSIPFFFACRLHKEWKKDGIQNTPVQQHKPSEENQAFFNAELKRLKNELSSAQLLYEDFIKQYPNNAVGHYNLSKIYLQNRAWDKAETEARKAVAIQDTNIYFLDHLTEVLIYQKKYQTTIPFLQALQKLKPNTLEFTYRLAGIYFRLKKYDLALSEIQQLEKLQTYDEDVTKLKLEIYKRKDDDKNAIIELEKIVAHNELAYQEHLELISYYEKLKQTEKVEAHFEKLKNANANNQEIQVALLNHYLYHSNKKKFISYLKETVSNKHIEEPLKVNLLLSVIDLNKKDSSLLQQNDLMQIVKEYAISDPDNYTANMFYADMLYQHHKTDEALAILTQFSHHKEATLNTWTQIISLFFEQNKWDSVLYYTNQFKKEYTHLALPLLYEGNAYYLQEKYKKAELSYLQALEKEKTPLAVLTQLYASLGDVYNNLKEYKKSDSSFEKALELVPTDATILNNYAYYLSERNERLDDAEKMSKLSLVLLPETATFLDTYGWILYKKGNYTDAKVYIEQAINANKNEDDATLFEHLGDVYNALKNKQQAIQNWQKALEKSPSNKQLLFKLSNE
ncbi:MAG: tetratricopeptide repeat protein [Chitinophagaceae bacterium]